MSSTAKTKADALALVQALVAGTKKHFPTGSLTFGNTTTTSAALITLLQSLIDAMQALEVAQKGASDAMAARRKVQGDVGPVIRAYTKFLRATFGTSAQQLADFGLVPEKARRPLTSEEQATKAEKSRGTRKLRGTKGPRQKAGLKASVETVSQPTVLKA